MSGEDKQPIFPPEKLDDVTPSQPVSENPETAILDRGDRETSATAPDRKSEKQMPEEGAGFRTPTGHRIPAATECPPPPQKLRRQPSKLKRKASPPGARLQFEAEVESIFRRIPDDTQEHKTKKARRDDKDPA